MNKILDYIMGIILPFLILCLLGTILFIYFNEDDFKKTKKETIIIQNTRYMDMRITGYTPTGNKTALNEEVKVGWTAAVSPKCAKYFLGSKVYIPGYGVRYVNDLTATWLDDKYEQCTLDIAVPTKELAMSIGNEIKTVIRIDQ